MNVGAYDLGDVCDVVDNMINAAELHRKALRMEHDTIITAEVSRTLFGKLTAWGAIDYLEIAYHIHVKIKES